MADEPTPRELDRRLTDVRDEVRAQFAALNGRLDKMPTNEVLLAHMATWDAQLRAVTSRVDDKADRTELAAVREDVVEVKQDMTEAKAQTRQARQWAITALLAAPGAVAAVVVVLRALGS